MPMEPKTPESRKSRKKTAEKQDHVETTKDNKTKALQPKRVTKKNIENIKKPQKAHSQQHTCSFLDHNKPIKKISLS